MGTCRGSKVTHNSKATPLLPTSSSSIKSESSGPCTIISRGIFLLLPIAACSLVLAALFLLAFNTGDGVKIAETSISLCLASYTPKAEVLLIITCGATLMFVVSIMRNIQINVYHRRLKSESLVMRAINFIAAMSNILSYCGFILLAMFDVNYLNDGARMIHYVGAFMYFICAGLYEVLHTFLLWNQRQYPLLHKVVFTVVGLLSLTSIIIFVATDEQYEFEWLAAALNAIYVGLVSTLFLVDPVDDELRAFFCCRRDNRRGDHTQIQLSHSPVSTKLLEGWKEAKDPKSGKVYYYNHTSGETSWKKPQLV